MTATVVNSFFTVYTSHTFMRLFLSVQQRRVHVCVVASDGGLPVRCEQPADSGSVKFSWSYLTCQQSEDLADQMCLCTEASSCVGTSECRLRVCVRVFLSVCENHANA